jgi:hypothetical protein
MAIDGNRLNIVCTGGCPKRSRSPRAAVGPARGKMRWSDRALRARTSGIGFSTPMWHGPHRTVVLPHPNEEGRLGERRMGGGVGEGAVEIRKRLWE